MFGINKDAYKLAKSIETIFETKIDRFRFFKKSWNIMFILNEDNLVNSKDGYNVYTAKKYGNIYNLELPKSYNLDRFVVRYINKSEGTIGRAEHEHRIMSTKDKMIPYNRQGIIDFFKSNIDGRFQVLLHECTHLLKYSCPNGTKSCYYSTNNFIKDIFPQDSIKEFYFNNIMNMYYILCSDEVDATIAELVYDYVIKEDIKQSNLTNRKFENLDINQIFDQLIANQYKDLIYFDKKEAIELISIVNHLIKEAKKGIRYNTFERKLDKGFIKNCFYDLQSKFIGYNKRQSYKTLDVPNYEIAITQLRNRFITLNNKLHKRYDKVINMSDEKKQEIKNYLES